eukprot:TRINITY_DN2624_c0_g1_i1.p1 TRINITY_DN2624_c0_g1~~TRINITY_DN2624_c0_g1_i1.p1  ORF type:complete len:110 (+),score=6.83 TRINITY_DN2624_c0_g1_i1:311-640(+)
MVSSRDGGLLLPSAPRWPWSPWQRSGLVSLALPRDGDFLLTLASSGDSLLGFHHLGHFLDWGFGSCDRSVNEVGHCSCIETFGRDSSMRDFPEFVIPMYSALIPLLTLR